jgi:hypothetical protein
MAIWIGEIILSFIMIMFALVFYVKSADFPVSINPVDVGPAAFPRLMVVLIITLAIMIIARSIIKRNERNENITIDNVLILSIGIGSLAAYMYIMPRIGYFITTPIYLFFLLFMQGNRKYLQMVATSMGFTLFAYLIFFRLFNVLLP